MSPALRLIRKESLRVAILLGLAITSRANADVITDWNAIAIPLLRNAPNVTSTRQFAMVHVAQFDAVNAVVGKYTPYVFNVAAPGASPEAAAAQAAHDVLAKLWPKNLAALDAALATSLAAISNGPAKTSGIALGAAVADQVWTLRNADATRLVVSNAFPGGPGLWSPTPGGAATPVSPQYASATPWVLRSAAQFQPGPPPTLDSGQWAADFNEIKRLGSTNSTERTPDQTDTGLFIIEFPMFILNDALKQAIAAHPLSLVDTARAFALMHMAAADAGIAVWEGKYLYNFWRPVTAIRAADTDGNDATAPDLDWLPLRTTPSHPEYPCAHCTISTAMCTALAAIFGDNVTFTLESPTLPGKPRSFHKFSEYSDLTLEGRLYAGFHYRNSSLVGIDLGQKVGTYVANNALVPGPALAGSAQPGEFRLGLKVHGGLEQILQYSTDFKTWQPVTNFTRTDLAFQYIDLEVGSTGRFYRAVSP